jgi:hypothetical protein
MAKENTLRRHALRRCIYSVLVLLALAGHGCKVSKQILELERPQDQIPLGQLESHLDYQDPDAGKPTYRRDTEEE